MIFNLKVFKDGVLKDEEGRSIVDFGNGVNWRKVAPGTSAPEPCAVP